METVFIFSKSIKCQLDTSTNVFIYFELCSDTIIDIFYRQMIYLFRADITALTGNEWNKHI